MTLLALDPREVLPPPATPDARRRDANAGRRVLEYIALAAKPSTVDPTWGVVWCEDVARYCGILEDSVRSMLTQMVKRGSIELVDLGDRIYRVRVTFAGWALLEARDQKPASSPLLSRAAAAA